MSLPVETGPRPMSVFISLPLMLLCLAGGGWIIHWYVATNQLTTEVSPLAEVQPPTQANLRGNRIGPNSGNQRPPERGNATRYIHAAGSRWNAQTETVHAIFSPNVRNGKINLALLVYTGDDGIPAEALNTRKYAKNMLDDPTRVQAMKLSAEQLQELRGLCATVQIAADNSTRDTLAALFTAWQASGDKAATEAKLLSEMDAAGRKFADSTRKEAINRAVKINRIMTPAMWDQNVKLGGGKPK